MRVGFLTKRNMKYWVAFHHICVISGNFVDDRFIRNVPGKPWKLQSCSTVFTVDKLTTRPKNLLGEEYPRDRFRMWRFPRNRAPNDGGTRNRR